MLLDHLRRPVVCWRVVVARHAIHADTGQAGFALDASVVHRCRRRAAFFAIEPAAAQGITSAAWHTHHSFDRLALLAAVLVLDFVNHGDGGAVFERSSAKLGLGFSLGIGGVKVKVVKFELGGSIASLGGLGSASLGMQDVGSVVLQAVVLA